MCTLKCPVLILDGEMAANSLQKKCPHDHIFQLWALCRVSIRRHTGICLKFADGNEVVGTLGAAVVGNEVPDLMMLRQCELHQTKICKAD
jgi:hypothetical protein